MVFLNPSILLGLLAASIPILIHLINFRKLQKIEFSTLAFLKELQKSKIKKIKIKQWLLLLLRVLIIIFLVLAFARPTLENVNIIGSASSAKTSSIFILDNSFSMNYIDEDGSYFNNSKKIAKELISTMQDGDEFSFLIFSDSIITTTNKDNALNIVEKMSISLFTEPIINKIKSATSFISFRQNINKEIFLFSDFQNSTFQSDIISDSVFSSQNADVKLYSFNMASNERTNVAISNLRLTTALLEVNRPIHFEATVYNYSAETITNATTSLFLNNKRVAQQNVTLQPQESKRINLETTLQNSGFVEARAELEDNYIHEDNTTFLNFNVLDKIKILLLYQNSNDIIFLEAALNSSAENKQIQVTKALSRDFLNENLFDYNLVFLVSTEIYNNNRVTDYLANGGNIVFIPPTSINSAQLSNIQKVIDLPKFDKIVVSKTNNNYSEFGDIKFNHPIFISLFENDNTAEIESPSIFKFIKYYNSPKYESIIKLIDGSLFLGEYNFGKGKVLFINSAASLEWNNFPLKGIFAPLITRMVIYLSSSQNNDNSFIVGEKIKIDVSKINFPLLDAYVPNGNHKITLESKNNFFEYKNTFSIGSYKFFNKQDLVYFSNINVNQRESDLTNINADSLSVQYSNHFYQNYLIIDKNDAYIEKIKQARFGTELWKYLLIIALLLALVEMFIARSTKKDLVSLN